MLKSIKKLFFYLLTSISIFFCAVILLLSFLLATQWGTQKTFSLLDELLGEALHIGEVKGDWINHVDIESIQYRDVSGAYHIQQLHLKIDWMKLLTREFSLEQLNIQNLQLNLLTAEEQKPSQNTKPFTGLQQPIELPLAVSIHHFYIGNITIKQDDVFKQSIDAVNVKAALQDEKFKLLNLSLRYDKLTLNLDSDVSLKETLPLELKLNIKGVYRNIALDTNLRLNGDIHQLKGVKLFSATSGNHNQVSAKLSFNIENFLNEKLFFATSLEVQPSQWHFNDKNIQIHSTSLGIEGGLKNLQTSLRGHVLHEQLGDIQIALTARKDNDTFYIDSSSINIFSGELVTAGQVIYEDKLYTDVRMTLNEVDLAKVSMAPIENLQSTIAINAFFDIENYWMQGDLQFDSSFLVNKKNISAQIQIQGEQEKINIHHLDVFASDNVLRFSGWLNHEEIDLFGKGIISEPQQILNDLEGQADLAIALQGQWKNLNTNIEIISKKWRYKEESILEDFQLSLQGDASEHHLTSQLQLPDEQLKADILITGTLDGSNLWKGHWKKADIITSSDYNWRLQEEEQIQFSLKPSPTFQDKLLIPSLCWQGEYKNTPSGRVCVKSNLYHNEDLAAAISIEQLKLAFINQWLPDVFKVEGEVDLEFDIKKKQQALFGQFNLHNTSEIEWIYQKNENEEYTRTIENIRIDANFNDQDIKSHVFLNSDERARLHAEMDIKSLLNEPQIQGHWNIYYDDFTYIAKILPSIHELQGQLSSYGQIEGALQNPSIKAHLQFRDGVVDIIPIGASLNAIQLNASIDEQQNAHIELGAKSGDGSLHLLGNALAILQDNRELSFDVNANGFKVLHLPELYFSTSASLNGRYRKDLLTLKGEVDINQAVITLPETKPSAVSLSDDVVIVDSQTDTSLNLPIEMNVKASLGPDVYFTGAGLQTRVLGSLDVSQNPNEPLLATGNLRLIEGYYRFLSLALNIDKGEVSFNGLPQNPSINFQATNQPKNTNVQVGVKVQGLVDNLTTELFSEPSMDDANILSYLTRGKPLDGQSNTEKSNMTQTAAMMGLKSLNSYFDKAAKSVNLDELRFSDEGESGEGEVVVGKRIGDLFFGYSQSLFSPAGTWLLEYRISNALSLESSYGESQSVDLLYHLESEQ